MSQIGRNLVRRARWRGGLSFLGATAALACWPATTLAADLNATPSNLASVYASAQGGDVIHLAAGDYGTFTGSSSKSSPVTLTASSGVVAKIYPSLSPATNLRFDGLTVDGAYLNAAKNITFVNNNFTGMTRVDTPTSTPNAGIVFDHNTFSGISPCSTCYEGRLTIRGYENTQSVGVKIINNLFGPAGWADGVQIIGGAYGVEIGPGNEFTGLAQSDAANSPHTDPIQLYGSYHTLITGNWLHNNATGIMAADTSQYETITQNVIQTTGYPWPIVLGGATGNVITHNTIPGYAIELDKANNGTASTGNVIKDNVAGGLTSASGTWPIGMTEDYNLFAGGGKGAHDVNAVPTFSGGANPNSYAGFQLAAGSAGTGAASDGTDVGITPGATPPPPPPPPPADTTPPDTSLTSGPTGTTSDSTPTFAFSSTETGSTFECRVDSGGWAACSSPRTLSVLADGGHTFSVRATDASANTDPSPAARTFTVNTTAPPPVDTTPPDTTITGGPTGPTGDSTPTFTFTATEAGSTFQCRVDTGAWAPCTSPRTLTTVVDGNHAFAVRATDAAGNTDASAAARSFAVDTTPPKSTITAGPPALSLSTSATLTFTATEAGAHFECRLDGGAWAACASPHTINGLATGPHTAVVRAIDAVGNAEAPGTSSTWTVLAPSVPDPGTVPTGPSAPTVPAPSPPPSDLRDLAPANDAPALDPAPATTTNPPPTVSLSRPTAGATFTRGLALTATARDDDGIDHVEFWVDGARVASIRAAPYSVSWTAPRSLGYRSHTVTARAFDAHGLARSVAVTVTRVHDSSVRAARARGWRVGSAPAAGGGTAVHVRGVPGQAVRVTLTRCDDSSGARAGTVRAQAERNGRATAALPADGMCVLRVQQLAGG